MSYPAIVTAVQSATRISVMPRGSKESRTVFLAELQDLRLARQPGDEEARFAFLAREGVRKLLIGKKVAVETLFTTKTGSAGVTLWDARRARNYVEDICAQGYVQLRPAREESPIRERYAAAIASAENGKKGRFADLQATQGFRNLRGTFSAGDRAKMVGNTIDAVVEHVFDAGTFKVSVTTPRAYLLRCFIAGVSVPRGDEPIYVKSREFSKREAERRYLHRDVKLQVVSNDGNDTLIARIIDDEDWNEFLLTKGLVTYREDSGRISGRAIEYQSALEKARQGRIGIWVDAPQRAVPAGPESFTGTVVDVPSCDSVVIRLSNGETERIWLSSLFAPRMRRGIFECDPWAVEAWDCLRANCAGRQATVVREYEKASVDDRPPRVFGTVTIGQKNLAEVLIRKGYADAARHSRDDMNRSSHYAALTDAQAAAEAARINKHSAKPAPTHHIFDLSDKSVSASVLRERLQVLRHAGRVPAIVLRVLGATMLKVYVPSLELAFRMRLSDVRGDTEASDASSYVKDRLLLRSGVEVYVEDVVRSGTGFTGRVYSKREGPSEDLAILLLERGMLTVAGKRCPNEYLLAQENARANVCGVWRLLVLDDERRDAQTSLDGLTSSAMTLSSFSSEVKMPVVVDSVGPIQREKVSEGRIAPYIWVRHAEAAPGLGFIPKNLVDFSAQASMMRGAVVAVEYESMYYRGRIAETSRSHVLVDLVDGGRTVEVPVENVHALCAEARPVPHPTLKCALHLCRVPEASRKDIVNMLNDLVGDKLVLQTFGEREDGRVNAVVWPDHDIEAEEQPLVGDTLNGVVVGDGLANLDEPEEGITDEIVSLIVGELSALRAMAKTDKVGMWLTSDDDVYADDDMSGARSHYLF